VADKPLSAKAFHALLRQARAFDIVELEIPGVLRFKREPQPQVKAAAPGDGVDSELAQDDDGPPDVDGADEPDPRFLLERIATANRKPRAS
jgi:hypothetical protein